VVKEETGTHREKEKEKFKEREREREREGREGVGALGEGKVGETQRYLDGTKHLTKLS
jgi:hypothetical protein